jgi:hypothetical protein
MSALSLPIPEPKRTRAAPRAPSPDYLPARMVNEFVYCPRLFFYEWVEGVFRESADTLEGSAQHKRVDARPSELPEAGAGEEKIHARSVTLSSERLKVIAKLDLVDAEGSAATPVDYKHGAPREGTQACRTRIGRTPSRTLGGQIRYGHRKVYSSCRLLLLSRFFVSRLRCFVCLTGVLEGGRRVLLA